MEVALRREYKIHPSNTGKPFPCITCRCYRRRNANGGGVPCVPGPVRRSIAVAGRDRDPLGELNVRALQPGGTARRS